MKTHEDVILDLSIVKPWVLRSAISNGVFEALRAAPLTSEQLAKQTHGNLEVVRAVIKYLEVLGYVSHSGAKFTLTARGIAAADLPQDLYSPLSPTTLFDSAVTELYETWLTGGPTPSRKITPFWEEVEQHPTTREICTRYQSSEVHFDGTQIIDLIEDIALEPDSAILDLGGANGALVKLLWERLEVSVGLLDLPAVVDSAEEVLAGLPRDKVNFHRGSFFHTVPSDYDIYVLNGITRDYTDADLSVLFRSLSDSMTDGAVLVISEPAQMFSDPYTQAESTLLLSLNTGGRLRKPHELATLAERSGFSSLDKHRSSERRYSFALQR